MENGETTAQTPEAKQPAEQLAHDLVNELLQLPKSDKVKALLQLGQYVKVGLANFYNPTED